MCLRVCRTRQRDNGTTDSHTRAGKRAGTGTGTGTGFTRTRFGVGRLWRPALVPCAFFLVFSARAKLPRPPAHLADLAAVVRDDVHVERFVGRGRAMLANLLRGAARPPAAGFYFPLAVYHLVPFEACTVICFLRN